MYKFILPMRYLLKRRITFLAITAIALCVFIVVVVMSVMSGLVGDFREKNHRYAGDCIVSSDSLVGFAYYEDFLNELDKAEFVKSYSPVIRGYGLLRQPNTETNIGIEITGIDPFRHSQATGFGDSLYYHRNNPGEAFKVYNKPDARGCVVGISRMHTSDAFNQYYHPDVPGHYDFEISCFPLNAKGALAKAGAGIVNTKLFSYSDDSHSGLVKIDENMIYLPFDDAQKLFEMGGATKRISAIHIKFQDGVSLHRGTEEVAKMWQEHVEKNEDKSYSNLLQLVSVENWMRYRASTIAPMEKEQTMLSILFFMLGIITVFVIFVVFYMIIGHKTRDIGILKSVGVSNYSVIGIFMIFAGIIGVIGAAIGAAGGCAFLLRINEMEDWLFENYKWQLWDRTVYAIGEIPHEIKIDVLAVIILSAIGASLLGALIPSVQAGIKKPAEVLQVSQV